jgi:hypothetical protein
MATAISIDLDAFKRSQEERDTEAQLAQLSDDAVFTVVDKEHPPSSPLELRGRDSIKELLQDVNSRDMTHEVVDLVAIGERLSWTVRCQYPDGTRVLCMATAEVRDGRIVRQSGIQAWDEA